MTCLIIIFFNTVLVFMKSFGCSCFHWMVILFASNNVEDNASGHAVIHAVIRSCTVCGIFLCKPKEEIQFYCILMFPCIHLTE